MTARSSGRALNPCFNVDMPPSVSRVRFKTTIEGLNTAGKCPSRFKQQTQTKKKKKDARRQPQNQ